MTKPPHHKAKEHSRDGDRLTAAPSIIVGQVQYMCLPAGWLEEPQEKNGAPGILSHYYHPPEKPDVQLCFYFRGHKVSRAASVAFHDVLDKPAHMLALNEIKSVKEIIGDRADPQKFAIVLARTEDWNGRRVLTVEGRYYQHQCDTHAMLIDADGTGSTVQEIFYQAPKAEYLHYLQQVKAALQSIEWKSLWGST
jgi:hypothetical protein